jgi:hypothetical protein
MFKPDYKVFIDTHGVLGVPLYMETSCGAFQKIFEDLRKMPPPVQKDYYRHITKAIYAVDITKMFDGLHQKEAWAIELWNVVREDLHYLLACRNILYDKPIVSVDQIDRSKSNLSF